MPEIMNVAGEGGTDFAYLKIWNLTYAVGDECANKPHDVMLVQWLLTRHFERKDKKKLIGDVGTIVNGIYNDQTSYMLKVFQYDVIRSQSMTEVKMDGQIFPVRQVTKLRKYALVPLNMSVHSYYQKYFRNPHLDPLLPGEFKQVLSKCGKI